MTATTWTPILFVAAATSVLVLRLVAVRTPAIAPCTGTIVLVQWIAASGRIGLLLAATSAGVGSTVPVNLPRPRAVEDPACAAPDAVVPHVRTCGGGAQHWVPLLQGR